MHYPIRILFVCTANAARSQMAEGFLREYGGKDFAAYSAGTEPAGEIHSLALQTMADNKIDISQQTSKSIDQLDEKHFDFVITLCDSARDNCPTFYYEEDNQPISVIHWCYPDPLAEENADKQKRLFHNIAVELRERIRLLVTIDRRQLQEKGIPVTM